METEEKIEITEVKDENIEKKEKFYTELVALLKKPYFYIPIIIIMIGIIIASFVPEKRLETTCYLNETCSAVSTEVTISTVDYTDYYLNSNGAKTYSNKTIITVYGGVFNNATSSQTINKSSFSLELKNGNIVKPKSAIFTDNVTYDSDKISLSAQRGVLFYMFYEVDDSVAIEDCRVIYYGNAIALVKRA